MLLLILVLLILEQIVVVQAMYILQIEQILIVLLHECLPIWQTITISMFLIIHKNQIKQTISFKTETIQFVVPSTAFAIHILNVNPPLKMSSIIIMSCILIHHNKTIHPIMEEKIISYHSFVTLCYIYFATNT